MRKTHKHLGLAAAAVVIMISVTGILLVHKKSLKLDKVSLRAPGYGSLQAAPDASDMLQLPQGDLLVGTKQGIYLRSGASWSLTLPNHVKKLYQHGAVVYAVAKQGLFMSSDNGRSWKGLFTSQEVKAIRFQSGRIIAATQKGIYIALEQNPVEWEQLLAFAPKNLDVRDFRAEDAGFLIIAKEGVFSAQKGGTLSQEPLSVSASALGTVDLQKLITDMHTGDFFGRYFFVIVDASAVGMVVLTLTGIYVWYIPWRVRQRR